MSTDLVTNITAYIKKNKNGEHITTLINRWDGKNKVISIPTTRSQIRPERKSLLWNPPPKPSVFGNGTDGRLLE